MSTEFSSYLYCLPRGTVVPLDSIHIDFPIQLSSPPPFPSDLYTMQLRFSWWHRGNLSNYQTKKILRRLVLGNTRVRIYEQRLAHHESLTRHETRFLASQARWTSKYVAIARATDPAMQHLRTHAHKSSLDRRLPRGRPGGPVIPKL